MAAKKTKDVSDYILRNPLTVKQMSGQLKLACDLYIELKLSEQHLKELVYHYADVHGNKFFGRKGTLNPTLEKIIGKKRKELVEIMLSNFQIALF